MGNTQRKLSKVRSPRVQITYDVEIGDAKLKKELPLVIGVMGDFTKVSNRLMDRKFIRVDKDNFNDIIKAMNPVIEFLVDSTLPEHPGKLAVSLKFNHINDFTPDKVVLQVEPLKKLIELRAKLSDLRNRAASNFLLKEQLSQILQDHSPRQESESDSLTGDAQL